MLDQERCILCWRCIRYLEEWEDKPQIGLFERGGETIIDVFPGRPVDAHTSGSIIDICPVGALTNRVARFRYRPWELRRTPSVCTHCPVGCNERLDERVHTLRRIVARENMAVNDEWICDKGRFLHQHVDHPARLKSPMIRDAASGALREATWEEAIAAAVEGLERTAEQHGPAAVGAVAAGRVANEAGYLLQKFFRTLVGTNNVDFAEGAAVAALPTGLPAIADIAKSDVIVLVGFDPAEATPVLDLHIKRAVRRKGAKLVIVNARAIELTRYAADPRTPGSAYIPVRPGDEPIALAALAAAIQAKKAAAQKQEPGQGPAPAASRPPARSKARPARRRRQSSICNLQPSTFVATVDALLAAKSPLFIYGPDAARGDRGRLTVTALSNLAVLLGAGDKLAYIGHAPNGQGLRDMGVLSDTLPGHTPVADAGVRDRLGKLWGVQPPAAPGLTYDQMLDGGVKASFILEADPAASPRTAEALRQLDFLVVHDLFLTDTAQARARRLPRHHLGRVVRHLHQPRAPRPARARRHRLHPERAPRLGPPDPHGPTLGRGPSAPRRRPAQCPTGSARKGARAAAKGAPTPKPWAYQTSQAVLEEIAKAIPAYAALRWENLTDQGQQWPAAALTRPPRRVEPLDAQPLPAATARPVRPRQRPGPVGRRRAHAIRGRPGQEQAAGPLRRAQPGRHGRRQIRGRRPVTVTSPWPACS